MVRCCCCEHPVSFCMLMNNTLKKKKKFGNKKAHFFFTRFYLVIKLGSCGCVLFVWIHLKFTSFTLTVVLYTSLEPAMLAISNRLSLFLLLWSCGLEQMVTYIAATVCLFTVLKCGEVTEINRDKSELSAIASTVIYLRILQLLLRLLCI